MLKDFKTVEYIFWLPIYRHFFNSVFFKQCIVI